MVTEALSHFGVVAGKGNIRGVEGPRNAVATGLALSYKGNNDYQFKRRFNERTKEPHRYKYLL